LLSATLGVSACSVAFVHPGDKRPGGRPCTASRVAPLADTVIAAPFSIAAAFFAVDVLDGYDSLSMNGDYYHGLAKASLAISLVPTVVFGSSAALGLVRTSRCRRLQDARPSKTNGPSATPR